jgi:hypothetical protein
MSLPEAVLASGMALDRWVAWEEGRSIPDTRELALVVQTLGRDLETELFLARRGTLEQMLAAQVAQPEGSGPQVLDRFLREVLRRWCSRQGRRKDSRAVARVLVEAGQLNAEERGRWMLQVLELVELRPENEATSPRRRRRIP